MENQNEEQPLYELKILVTDKLNTLTVTSLKPGYKPGYNEIIGALDSMKINYQVHQSAERVIAYHKQKKKAITESKKNATNISDTNLSTRAKGLLKDRGVKTLLDLRNADLSKIKLWRNCGEKTMREIIDLQTSLKK